MFTIITNDDWVTNNGKKEAGIKTYDEAVEECKALAESSPDTEYWVVELKAKVVAEIKITVATSENEMMPKTI